MANVSIKQRQLGNLLVFAARYAHSRNTGGALEVVSTALEQWDNIDQQTKQQLVREAKFEATCNSDDWAMLISRFETEFYTIERHVF